MEQKEKLLIYGELISRCWDDEDFKKRFLAEPNKVLEEAGIELEPGVRYHAVEAAANERYLVLPHEKVQESIRELSKLMLHITESSDEIIPEGTRVVILQNTPTDRYFVLKAAPDIISDVELDMVVGGKKKGSTAAKAYHVGVAVDVAITAVVDTVAAANAVGAATVAFVAAGVVFI